MSREDSEGAKPSVRTLLPIKQRFKKPRKCFLLNKGHQEDSMNWRLKIE